MSSPASRTAPAAGETRPEMALTSVLLPAAFAPTTEMILPRGTSSEIPCSTRSCPYATCRPCTSSKEALLAEVRLDHGGIAGHLVGAALGDLLAVVQHDDAPRDRHDDVHDVLDHEEGHAVVAVQAEEEGDGVLGLDGREAGHDLVEQDHLGVDR